MQVIKKAMLSFDSAYNIPNSRVTGNVCKTNLPSNTALRGFGAPQAMFVMETIITQFAAKANMDVTKVFVNVTVSREARKNTKYLQRVKAPVPEKLYKASCGTLGFGMFCLQVREINLFQEGDRTHYKMVTENCTIGRCWSEVLQSSDMGQRKRDIDTFNRYMGCLRQDLISCSKPAIFFGPRRRTFDNKRPRFCHFVLDAVRILGTVHLHKTFRLPGSESLK